MPQRTGKRMTDRDGYTPAMRRRLAKLDEEIAQAKAEAQQAKAEARRAESAYKKVREEDAKLTAKWRAEEAKWRAEEAKSGEGGGQTAGEARGQMEGASGQRHRRLEKNRQRNLQSVGRLWAERGRNG